jgi:uracil-DNA glycosylase family 4
VADSLRQLERDVATCTACPRLVTYLADVDRTKRRAFRDEDYWSRPVPGYGDPAARVLIVGLAPAAHGANRTGRMFTGDGTGLHGSSEFLARALHAEGMASLPTSRSRDDGQTLTDVFITGIARCAPPANRPTSEEIARCAKFLHRELDLLPELRTVLALGKLAWDQLLRVFAERGRPTPRPRPRFGHGAAYRWGDDDPLLLGSYHPSRQNTQTGRLQETMLRDVLRRARQA